MVTSIANVAAKDSFVQMRTGVKEKAAQQELSGL
jgi:hypothetical protein